MLKTKSSEEKGNLSSEKNFLAYFFSFHRTWKTSSNNLEGYTRSFERYCASYMIISLGPKKSRTKFFKIKAIVPKKKVLAHFCFILPFMSNFLLGSTRCFCKYGTSYKVVSLTPKSLLKTQTFGKKSNFPVKKNIL